MAAKFEVSPEKEASFLTFFHRQLTFTPAPVHGVDLSGQTAIVTGSNGGVGLECGRQLLDLGLSKLILAVRDEAKGQAAAAGLARNRDAKNAEIEVWKLDLSDYDSVVAFADRAKTLATLDIVIMNAAHEEGFQVAYLSTALLTLLLLPTAASKRPRQKQPTRITFVTSEGAAWSKFTERDAVPLLPAFDAPVVGGSGEFQNRHFTTKLLGLLFLAQLAAVMPADRDVAILNAASPGMCHDTRLARGIDDTVMGKLVKTLVTRRVGYTAAVGSRTVVDAAVNHGAESHGQYFSGQKIRPLPPIVYKEEGKVIMERLWKETLDELSFAGVKEIIDTIAKGQS
ncbi:NAD(P)-binding protein [Apiospora phragmitis]|uniref:NAD(P)-binding protein n=1 Tax=Apiospora phragmitis TaxID=2905665 RepID=A0ABR1WR06_9PEZI